jgi:hypothetical protein
MRINKQVYTYTIKKLNFFISHFFYKTKTKTKMFSTIIEFVLCSFCSKFEFNTLQLLSLTSKDVKDEIDKMRIPVRFRFNKVIKKMGFDIPLTITTRFKITNLDFTMSDITEEYFTKLLQLISL